MTGFWPPRCFQGSGERSRSPESGHLFFQHFHQRSKTKPTKPTKPNQPKQPCWYVGLVGLVCLVCLLSLVGLVGLVVASLGLEGVEQGDLDAAAQLQTYQASAAEMLKKQTLIAGDRGEVRVEDLRSFAQVGKGFFVSWIS